ncbi:hypothetical protein [Streptomyces albidus (ex Kaewkla and Franco 2022)]|uniref:hypothetical protein n=1 Tax=Streptomyces albidus (ex Kaewkla and Franco 2022) TaxID=722709 RepID=UPI0015EF543D|nr:hypothetical protein [Streptomyces albidus (ex Kaewkla and Franco 2022)]
MAAPTELIRVGAGHALPVEEQREALNAALPPYLERTGGAVQETSPEGLTVTFPSAPETHFPIHILLTVLTGGAWALFVWLPIVVVRVMRTRRPVTVKVQEDGTVYATR